MEAQEILEKARKGCDQAEVIHIRGQSTPVIFEANRLKSIEEREYSEVGLRVLKNDRFGLSSSTRTSDTLGLVERSLASAAYGPISSMEFPSQQIYPEVSVYDANTPAIALEEMISIGERLIEQMRVSWPDVQWDCRVSRSTSNFQIINSRGCSASYDNSSFSISIEGSQVRGEDMLFVQDFETGCRPILNTSSIKSSLDRQLTWAQNLVAAPVGEIPVIFTPMGLAGVMLGPLLAGFNGKAVLQGSSPLVGKLGERLLDPRITIWDDPTLPYVPGSRACDDEGIPSRRLALVHEGIIQNFLYDLQTAGQAGTQSTGSASRAPGTLPSPSFSVVIVQPGMTSMSDIIKDQEQALIVDTVLGAGQGNVLGGDFSANVLLGYHVSHGEVIGRVKDTVITGNSYRALQNIRAIGSDSRWLGGTLSAPTICTGGVTVSSQQ